MTNPRRRRRSSLAAREARLAYLMLLPAFAIVFAVVIFPVLANFWLAFKEVSLGNLRPPQTVLRERVMALPDEAGDPFEVRWQMRNSSQDVPIRDVRVEGRIPEGLQLQGDLPSACEVQDGRLTCDLGTWEGGYRENLEFAFTADEAFLQSDIDRSSPMGAVADGNAANVLTNFDFSLANFERVLSGSAFWPSLRVTLWYTIGGTVFSILLGLFAAQLLNERFFGHGLLRGLFLFPYVAPVIAVAFTWVFFLDPFSGSLNLIGQELGILGASVPFFSQRNAELSLAGFTVTVPLALSSVIAFEAWRYFPFAFLFILARFQAIPDTYYEAAEVDGASPFQKFWWITLPQLYGVLSTLFLLRFIWTFNKFDDVFLLTGGAAGTSILPIRVYDYAFAQADIGAGAATAVVLFLVLALFLTLFFRYVAQEDDA